MIRPSTPHRNRQAHGLQSVGPRSSIDTNITPPVNTSLFFANRVSARLHSGLLKYSDRLSLLREADRLGIKRFDANLIIAMTQHRHTPSMGGTPRVTPPPTPRGGRGGTITRVAITFLTLQSLLIAAAWYLLS